MSPASDLLEDLAVPYVLVMSSVEQDGTWLRRAEYPELPGCVTEAYSALEALEEVDALRVRIILEMRRRGERPPRPRPPLKSGLPVTGVVDVDKFLRELLAQNGEDHRD